MWLLLVIPTTHLAISENLCQEDRRWLSFLGSQLIQVVVTKLELFTNFEAKHFASAFTTSIDGEANLIVDQALTSVDGLNCITNAADSHCQFGVVIVGCGIIEKWCSASADISGCLCFEDSHLNLVGFGPSCCEPCESIGRVASGVIQLHSPCSMPVNVEFHNSSFDFRTFKCYCLGSHHSPKNWSLDRYYDVHPSFLDEEYRKVANFQILVEALLPYEETHANLESHGSLASPFLALNYFGYRHIQVQVLVADFYFVEMRNSFLWRVHSKFFLTFLEELSLTPLLFQI